jgi:type I restriction enzyme, S subunit
MGEIYGMKKYSKMKDSDVEWIEDIPEHWKILRCFSLTKETSIKNMENEENLSVYRDFGVILRKSRDDNFNRLSDDLSNYKLVEKGDLVLNKMKCFMGSLGISNYRGIVSPAYKVYKITQKFNGKFLHYLLRSKLYVQEFERLSTGIRPNQWELKHVDFRNIPILKPSLEEQDKIVEFLDKEITTIDSLIKKNEKIIELLEEKRHALITATVTGKIDVRNMLV